MQRPTPSSLVHLSSDPVSGIPYYRDGPDTLTPFVDSHITTHSSVAQLPGNMLGARARAAEYNAARAATARQQASRESDESRLPPRPTPISLGAFTRNASYSRNRGAKSFVPLILSEEEEQSTSNTEHVSDANQEVSPPTEPVVRAASLPPPQKLPRRRMEMDTNVQTPFRHRSPRLLTQMYPHMMRNVYPSEVYDFSTAGSMFHPQQHLPYHQTQPFMSHHPLLPISHAGWYTPPDYNGSHHLYTNERKFPMPPYLEDRPNLHRHNLSQDSISAVGLAKGSSSEPAADSTHPTTPVTKLGGPALHVFGPDDLSPTKIEVKQRAREKYFAKHGTLDPTPEIAVPTQQVTTPDPNEAKRTSSLAHSTQARNYSHAVDRRMEPDNVRGLLIDQTSIAPIRVRGSAMSDVPFSKVNGPPAKVTGIDTDVFAFDRPNHYPQQNSISCGSPSRHTQDARPKGMYVDNIREQESAGRSTSSLRDPSSPEIDGTQMRTLFGELERQRCEQVSNIDLPLTDIKAAEWCEFRGPTEEDRQKTIAARKAITSSLVSNTNDSELSTVKHDDLCGSSEGTMGEYECRMKLVCELANEMQYKWEHGGQFRGPIMSKEEAESHAGRLKEIGHIIATLNIQLDTTNNVCHLGSRPYVQPPEYAIERSVGTENGIATSLFEEDDDEGKGAPARLARDPRFRAQMNQGTKVRGDEERIPRMFTARSRFPC